MKINDEDVTVEELLPLSLVGDEVWCHPSSFDGVVADIHNAEPELQAYLVHAANCHHALLAACKGGLVASRLAAIHQHPDSRDYLPWYRAMQDAIAKAEQTQSTG